MKQNGLRKVLLANAGFSILTGATLIAGAGPLSEIFAGVHPWLLRGIGIGLLLFAADILATCRNREVSRGKALYFSYGDFGWVGGSVVLLLAAPLSALAASVVLGAALIVLVFGIAQVHCIRSGSTQPV